MSFASSVTFDLPLEDLIQGLGDTSWVLVEGWEGGASGKVKSQLPSLHCGKGNGTPLQYSYMENPVDGGAW